MKKEGQEETRDGWIHDYRSQWNQSTTGSELER